MLKRGQITIFVIIGIVILALVLGFSYLSSKANEAKLGVELSDISQLPIEIQQKKENIEICLEEKTKEATLIIGSTGGYILNKPSKTINYNENEIAYIDSISKDNIQNEIKEYLIENFGECKDNSEVNNVEVEILNDKIIVNAEMPINLESGDSSIKISFFTTEYDVKLGSILNIMENSKENFDCMTCLVDEAENNKMKITINILDNAKIMEIKDENYMFNFAVD